MSRCPVRKQKEWLKTSLVSVMKSGHHALNGVYRSNKNYNNGLCYVDSSFNSSKGLILFGVF